METSADYLLINGAYYSSAIAPIRNRIPSVHWVLWMVCNMESCGSDYSSFGD